jgi:hypothetical protein
MVKSGFFCLPSQKTNIRRTEILVLLGEEGNEERKEKRFRNRCQCTTQEVFDRILCRDKRSEAVTGYKVLPFVAHKGA